MLSPTDNPVQLLHGTNMTNKTSYHTAQTLGETPLEEAKSIALWTQDFEHVDCSEVDEHGDEHKDDIINNEILDTYSPRKKPAGGPSGNNATRSAVEQLMKDPIKTYWSPYKTHHHGIVERAIEDAFLTGYVEQN